jgi:hypothetical protein
MFLLLLLSSLVQFDYVLIIEKKNLKKGLNIIKQTFFHKEFNETQNVFLQ